MRVLKKIMICTVMVLFVDVFFIFFYLFVGSGFNQKLFAEAISALWEQYHVMYPGKQMPIIFGLMVILQVAYTYAYWFIH